MSKKTTKYRRLQDACERLRDVAASHVAETRRLVEAAQQRYAARNHNLNQVVEETREALHEARGVAEIELLAGDINAAEHAVREASHDVAEASETVAQAVAHLRSQERRLRASQRLFDKALTEDRDAEDKAAQRVTDDFAIKYRRTA